jgi:hypothetical protein
MHKDNNNILEEKQVEQALCSTLVLSLMISTLFLFLQGREATL